MSRKGSARDVVERMKAITLRERPGVAAEASAALSPPSPPPSAPPAESQGPSAAPQQVSSEPTQRIRYTVDLDPGQHWFMKRFAVDARVDASEVIRSLLQLLQDDPELSARVQAQLRPKALRGRRPKA